MARPLIPFVQNGYYASRNWIPLVKGNGFTTSGGGEQEEVWETASGSIVTFDAVAAPLRQLSVSVEPVQNLNGYDNPWPAGGGKNLFGGKSLTQTVNTIACEITSDSALSLNGTNSSSSAAYFTIYPNTNGERYLMKAGTYTFSSKVAVPSAVNITFGFRDSTGASIGVNSAVLTSSAQSVTRTIEQDFEIFCNAQISGGSTVNYNGGLQIESGSSATAWTPYSNVCPITGFDSVTVNRTGKNLLTAQPVYTTYYETECLDLGRDFTFDSITISFTATNASYTVNGNAFIQLITNDGTKVYKRPAEFTNDSGTAFTVNTPTNGRYKATFHNITFKIVKFIYTSAAYSRFSSDSLSDFQLELGSTATAYEPYQGNEYTIQLGETVYGGTLDVVNGTMVVDRVGITPTIDLLQSINTYGIANFRFGLSDASTKAADQAKAICSALKYQKTLIVETTEPGFILSSAWTGYLRIPQEIANTKETAQSWVSTNNVIVVYYLATPFELTLTPEQISTLQGTNNVWSDAGDVTVEYRAR